MRGGEPPTAGRFRPHQRLTSGGEYRRVFRTGIRLDGRLFLLVAAVNGRSHHRLGLAAGRKMGGATDRNRAKRLIRESFRRLLPQGLPSMDLVLVPKREIAASSQGEVDREYCERLRRLAARYRRRGETAAPRD